MVVRLLADPAHSQKYQAIKLFGEAFATRAWTIEIRLAPDFNEKRSNAGSAPPASDIPHTTNAFRLHIAVENQNRHSMISSLEL